MPTFTSQPRSCRRVIEPMWRASARPTTARLVHLHLDSAAESLRGPDRPAQRHGMERTAAQQARRYPRSRRLRSSLQAFRPLSRHASVAASASPEVFLTVGMTITPEGVCKALREAGIALSPADLRIERREERWVV